MKKFSTLLTFLPIYILVLVAFIMGAAFLNESVTALSENSQISHRKCIIIDPGHGGVDGGATSCNGILESQINLEISLKLNDLMHLIGLETVMIRTTDCSVYTHGNSIAQKKISDLKERVRIVNTNENSLLISIHQNHFSDSKYYGPQVFYGRIGESHMLATTMQSALTNTLCPESKRKAKSASGVYLLDKINHEGILIECGFLSNYEEEAKLRDPEYQKQLCSVIGTVCANYFNRPKIT